MSISALVTVARENWYDTFDDGLHSTIEFAFAKDPHYTLFRSEDWAAWLIFSCVFACLILVDNAVLNRTAKTLTVKRACVYTLFWILCACAFALWVRWWYGPSQAFMWLSGYMLEWMLSFDNLFVFHLIFSVYGTPDHLKHRPLFLGICGAVFFRLVFIFVGEYLMHAMFLMHLVFGGFLVYTGVKTVTSDDDDDDPSQHPLVCWLQKKIPFVSAYDNNGAFFVRVPTDEQGSLCPHLNGVEEAKAPDGNSKAQSKYGTLDFSAAALKSLGQQKQQPRKDHGELRATMLFLVVCCLELSDMLFAVDSVSAIVAQVNDLFLAYTSAVFAMLGLRATFFIIDELVRLFSLLKYGVAAVLVFIGMKLMAARICHVPPMVVCAAIGTAIGLSIVASIVQERWAGDSDCEDKDEEKVCDSADQLDEERESAITSDKLENRSGVNVC